MTDEFWDFLQELVDTSEIVIDRPKGFVHNFDPGNHYPVDYGYLQGTTSLDSGGVDIWVGSSGQHKVIGVACTIDLYKRDTELKIILDCNDDEISSIRKFSNAGKMRALFILK